MPGHKVYLQDGGEISEGLTCCYCRLVLKDPMQTNESGLRLCRECFEEVSKLKLVSLHDHNLYLIKCDELMIFHKRN